MVASSSNILLVASSSRQGQIRRGSTKPNDHDLTSEIENRRGYMIGSTNTNNISGISGTNNLKDMIMLETVAPMAFASASAASTSTSTTPPSATKSEEKPRPRPRPRRKKMASTGVDAMKKMIVTDSSVVVALPESPTVVTHEQHDDIESVFNNIQSASNRKVLAFDLSVPSMPSMPDMLSMPAPALPPPAMNQSSKQKNEMSHSNNDNDNANAPMMKKKKKKQLHMGRRLRQIKKRLSLTSKSKSKTSSSSKQEVCLSPGTSATTSTSSFGQTSQEEEDTDVSIIDMMSMMTSLKPRVHSMFHEDEEEMMPMMPVLSAPPCPLSSSTDDAVVVAVTTLPLASFSSKLDTALSVFSPNEGDGADDVGDVVADVTDDDWGIFTSYDDDEEEEEEDHEREDQTHNYYNHQSKPFSSRSSFTKHTSNPCFPPRAHLPIIFAATAGAE